MVNLGADMNGKKTYVIGIGMILFAVGGVLSGHHDISAATEILLEGLGLIFLRHGVASVKKP